MATAWMDGHSQLFGYHIKLSVPTRKATSHLVHQVFRTFGHNFVNNLSNSNILFHQGPIIIARSLQGYTSKQKNLSTSNYGLLNNSFLCKCNVCAHVHNNFCSKDSTSNMEILVLHEQKWQILLAYLFNSQTLAISNLLYTGVKKESTFKKLQHNHLPLEMI